MNERQHVTRPVTWTGATQSAAVDVRYYGVAGIYLPAAFAGNSLSVQVDVDGAGTWKPLYDDSGAAVSLSVAADRVYALPIACFGFPQIRCVSSSSETCVGTLFAMS